MDKTLSDLKDLVEKEIRKITAKNDITPQELENMTKSLCLLEKIKEMEGMDGMDNGHSGYAPHMYHPMGYNYRSFDGRSYGDDMSYMRGRDARTGRYMSRDEHGYSGHSIKDRMIDKLEQMYDEAKTEHERQIVDEWVRRLRD